MSGDLGLNVNVSMSAENKNPKSNVAEVKESLNPHVSEEGEKDSVCGRELNGPNYPECRHVVFIFRSNEF